MGCGRCSRSNLPRARQLRFDGTDIAEAAVTKREQKPLLLARIADQLSHRLDTAAERGLRDEATMPDLVEQFVLRNNPIMMGNQVVQHVKHLRLNRKCLAGTTHLEPGGIQLKPCKSVDLGHTRNEALSPAGKKSILAESDLLSNLIQFQYKFGVDISTIVSATANQCRNRNERRLQP